MANYEEARFKTFKKNFQDGEQLPELFATARQRTKIGNAFANNISTNIKFNKA